MVPLQPITWMQLHSYVYNNVVTFYRPSASLHSRVLDMLALEILFVLELRVEVLANT